MTFTQLAAVIASLALAITSLQVSAETEVEADFQDAVIQDSVVETTAESVKNSDAPQGGVIILNTNSNDNKNDSEAEATAETDVVAVADVEASNEVLSQADAMRSARQAAEISTEQRIVEELEASRLEDERRRADVLFGDRFESLEKKTIKKEVIKKEDDDYRYDDETIEKKVIVKEIIKEKAPEVAVVAPVQTQVVAVQPPQHLKNDRTYMGFSLGGMSYDASNVESNYAAGVMIGRNLGNGASVEGSFLFSNHFVDKAFWLVPLYSEVSQYDIGLIAKYSLSLGALKPFVGAGANYVYRNYQDRIYYGGGYGSDEFGDEANTHAVDGSLLAGLDIELSRSFVIGAEFKYSTNVFVKNDEPVFAQSWAQPSYGKPLEEIDRSQVTVNAKFMF